MLSSTPAFNFTSSIGDTWARQFYLSQESVENLMLAEQQSANQFTLTYFQSSLNATVLEDTVCELDILEECNNEIRVIKTNLDMTLLLANKFNVLQRKPEDPLDVIDSTRLDCLEYKLQKLQDDRNYVKEMLIGTYIDLSLDRSFLYLAEQVKAIIDRINNREFLMEEEAKNKVLRRDLNRQLRQKRNQIKSVYYDTDIFIQNLRTKVEDTGLNTNIRSRYVDNWQTARTEQHHQTIHEKEAKPLATITHFKRRTDQEHRVHTEIELLVNIAINEKLQEIEDWMAKYDKDIEALDLKIQKKRNQLEDMIKKKEGLEETIEEHDRLCKNWVHFKEEREKARLYHEKMTNSAITIQAWWRGLLVRNQLGPYKPQPKNAGGKKKK